MLGSVRNVFERSGTMIRPQTSVAMRKLPRRWDRDFYAMTQQESLGRFGSGFVGTLFSLTNI